MIRKGRIFTETLAPYKSTKYEASRELTRQTVRDSESQTVCRTGALY